MIKANDTATNQAVGIRMKSTVKKVRDLRSQRLAPQVRQDRMVEIPRDDFRRVERSQGRNPYL
jgi:hypothetical protein